MLFCIINFDELMRVACFLYPRVLVVFLVREAALDLLAHL